MKESTSVPLDDELQSSYIDYAMSVIIGRAIPDARDGLKPVQRRILYAMYDLKNLHNQPTKKSARIVGEIIGKYHPHGDTAVYEALVRMAQPFSMNHRLVEGQGNMGCFTKDTKIRLADGRDADFEELIKDYKEGKRNWAFTFNTSTDSIEISEIKNPRLTRSNAELVEVTLDNGAKIKCTPDHRFLLRTGTYKQARDLKSGDSLMPLYTQAHDGVSDKNFKDYDMVMQPKKNEWQFIHHLADEWNIKKGIYAESKGRICHHVDINKKNNNPTNIMRLNWEEHWKIHYKLASWRHKNDPEYVKKLAAGRKKCFEENHTLLSARMSNRNKRDRENSTYRKRHSDIIKMMWKNESYKHNMAEAARKRLKSLWKNEEFKKSIGKLKSEELKKKWQSEDYKKHTIETSKIYSRKLWDNPDHRERISTAVKRWANTPSQIKTYSERATALWRDPKYRAKYAKDHFSKMSKKSWSNPETIEMHKEKAHNQWKDQSFRTKITNNIRNKNIKRMQKDQNMIRNLTEHAKCALHTKWQDPGYKKLVIRSKILGYVSALTSKYPKVTLNIYDLERKNNGVPTAEHALKYFSSFDDIIKEAKTHNHKVKEVTFLTERADTYDLTTEPWHNFALSTGVFVHNSIDGDPPAAMRYTEVRLTKMAEEMLDDLDKETVDFLPNFDNTEHEPCLLPSKVPNLLVNGSSGIAVGVATSMPPHNLNEVCDAVVYMLDNKSATAEEIMGIIKGPDFPTGGIVIMSQNAYNGYRHGRGQATVRAKAEIDAKRNKIIINEMPYNVNKASAVQAIAELVKGKQIVGIKDLRDESDKNGVRIVIDLKDGVAPEQVLNMLYKHTQLEVTFPIINLAVIGKSLRSLNVVQLLTTFIDYRKEVVVRRSRHELAVAQDRLHIVKGLLVAIGRIEEIITDIKASGEVAQARSRIMSQYGLSDRQANAILDMKLSRLTRLESSSLEAEAAELEKASAYHSSVIADPDKVAAIIREETLEVRKLYGRGRKTEILNIDEPASAGEEDLISDEKVTIIMTSGGYVKRQGLTSFKEQGRGGRGVIAINLKEGDYVKQILACNNKDSLLCISSAGRAYWIKAYNIPESGRYSEGKAIVNLLDIKDEKIIIILNIKSTEKSSIAFLTARGVTKKTDAALFSRPRSNGIRAINLRQGDELTDAILYSSEKYLTIITRNGKAIKFEEADIRQIGRSASGVRGIRIKGDDAAKNIIAAGDVGSILTITENGYGKITDIAKYRTQGRGGGGVINIKVSEKTGKVSRALFLSGEQQVMLINSRGISITIPISSIRITGRSASGVRLMRIEEGAKVVDARVIEPEEPEQSQGQHEAG